MPLWFRNKEKRVEEARHEEKEKLKKEREIQRLLNLQTQMATEKRKALFGYKFGAKWSHLGLDMSDIDKSRIGVFGPTGSGKSCFISTCERVVRSVDKGSSPLATSGTEGTIVLEDFLPEMFFRLVDTRGFFNYDQQEHCEFNNILFSRIKSGDVIERPSDRPLSFDQIGHSTSHLRDTAAFSDWIHNIIIVLSAEDRRLRNDVLRERFTAIRSIMRTLCISPVTVVTHKDRLQTRQQCNDAIDFAKSVTGSSPDHIYLVANYCPENPGRNPETELRIAEILLTAFELAELYVRDAKQKERSMEEALIQKILEDGSVHECPSLIDAIGKCSVDVFLKKMQAKYGWDNNAVSYVLSLLSKEDIKTVRSLHKTWSNVNGSLPLDIKKHIDRHLALIFKPPSHLCSFKVMMLCGFLLLIVGIFYVYIVDGQQTF